MAASERKPLVNPLQNRNQKQQVGHSTTTAGKPAQTRTVNSPSGRGFSFKSKGKTSTPVVSTSSPASVPGSVQKLSPVLITGACTAPLTSTLRPSDKTSPILPTSNNGNKPISAGTTIGHQSSYQRPNQFHNTVVGRSSVGRISEPSKQETSMSGLHRTNQNQSRSSVNKEAPISSVKCPLSDDSFGSDSDLSLLASPPGWNPQTSRKTDNSKAIMSRTLVKNGNGKDAVPNISRDLTVLRSGGSDTVTVMFFGFQIFIHTIPRNANKIVSSVIGNRVSDNTFSASTNLNARPGINNAELQARSDKPVSQLPASKQSKAGMHNPAHVLRTPSKHRQSLPRSVAQSITPSGQSAAATSVIDLRTPMSSSSTPSRVNISTPGASDSAKRKGKCPGPAGALPKLVSAVKQQLPNSFIFSSLPTLFS